MTTKVLGGRVPNELHLAAHITANLRGQSVQEWLAGIVEQNVDPRAVDLAKQQLFLSQSGAISNRIGDTETSDPLQKAS